jgi:hypothetical protein
MFFAHKKNYGRAGYADDPLPNIVHIAIWDACLHCMALLCTQLNYVVVSGQFFFFYLCGPLEKKKKKMII